MSCARRSPANERCCRWRSLTQKTDARALRSTCEEALELSSQQERLIDALLTLATSGRGIEVRQSFDLGALAANVVLNRPEDAERQGIQIDTTITQTTATGDPSLIESLLVNLVDNAISHNHPGGRVQIATTTRSGRPTLETTQLRASQLFAMLDT